MIIGGGGRGQRLPVGFLVPVNVVPDVAWDFVHHTAPDSGVALDSVFKLFSSLLHTQVLRSINDPQSPAKNKRNYVLSQQMATGVAYLLTVSVNPPKTSLAVVNSSILYLLNTPRFAVSCTEIRNGQPRVQTLCTGRVQFMI